MNRRQLANIAQRLLMAAGLVSPILIYYLTISVPKHCMYSAYREGWNDANLARDIGGGVTVEITAMIAPGETFFCSAFWPDEALFIFGLSGLIVFVLITIYKVKS